MPVSSMSGFGGEPQLLKLAVSSVLAPATVRMRRREGVPALPGKYQMRYETTPASYHTKCNDDSEW